MKAISFMLAAISALIISGRVMGADREIGSPTGFIAGCEADLNADGNPDTALLIDTSKGHDLVVIIRSPTNPKAFILDTHKSKLYLACNYGKQLKETDAGPAKRKGRTCQINGAYLKLSQPEGASIAYFWSKDKFEKIRLSD